MNRKAQVLIIFLWILVALAIFTLSLSDRISIVLKFTQTRKDLLKAEYLAYAGLNRAIVELKNDDPGYDGLTDTWQDDQAIFGKIQLTDNPDEYAAVINGERAGVTDEESKININQASQELLFALMEYYNVTPAQEIVDNLLVWRGDLPDSEGTYAGLGYPCKARPLTNIAELILIKGMNEENFKKIAKAVTVYGKGGININTASPETIKILCRGLAKQQGRPESYADIAAEAFVSLRNTKLVFKDKSEIDINFPDSGVTNIFNALIEAGRITSDNFLVEVSGNTGKIKTRLSVIYNRKQSRIESWYEE